MLGKVKNRMEVRMNLFNEKQCLETINTFVRNSANSGLIARLPISSNDLIGERLLRCLLFDELTMFYTEHCLDQNYSETEEGYFLNQAIDFLVFCGDV